MPWRSFGYMPSQKDWTNRREQHMLTFLLLVAGAATAAAVARAVVITSRIVIASDPSAAAEEPSAARLAATGAVLLVAGVTCLLSASGLVHLVDLILRIGVLALAGAIVAAGASAWACRAGRCLPVVGEVSRDGARERRRPDRGPRSWARRAAGPSSPGLGSGVASPTWVRRAR